MIDFQVLARSLLGDAEGFCRRYLSNGKRRGNEWVVGDLSNEAGESLSINLATGAWADFAGDAKGGDLISLYAAIHNIGQLEAARALQGGGYHAAPTTDVASAKNAPAPKTRIRRPIIPVPDSAGTHPCIHHEHGKPATVWAYRDGQERLLGYVARYNLEGGGKEIIPWTYADDGWRMGQWVAPRPLYGLERLAARPDAPVLIVEGEKCAEAAAALCGPYVAVTWPGGSNAAGKAGWQALKGRRCLIWPDADQAGIKAGGEVAKLLHGIAAEVKVIAVAGETEGWDVADAVQQGWDFDQWVQWARPRAKVIAEPRPPAPEPAAAAPPKQPGKVTNLAAAREARSGAQPALAPAVSNLRQTWDNLGLACAANGMPLSNASNVLLILSSEPFKDLVWYDEFLVRYLTKRTTTLAPATARAEWTDAHAISLLIALQRDYGLSKLSINHIQDAVVAIGQTRRTNELRSWLSSLVWDGTARLASFLPDVFGTADTAYTRAAGRNFWIALAARVMRPGCKADNMLVLEGAQGVGKSTALRIIGGDYFAECHEDIGTKDFLLSMQGKLLIEISELSSFSPKAVDKIKGVISNPVDRLRVPYGRGSADFPRQSIFAGTTNRDDWNHDETGARRFWPVRCTDVNLSALREARGQYFAEAVALVNDGATWWTMPADETRAEQEERRQHDEWEPMIADWLTGRTQVEVRVILLECMKFAAQDIGQADQNRVSRCLRVLGWKRRTVRDGHRVKRVYTRARMEEEADPE